MADQHLIQADGSGALDLNKLPEMQQQPIPEGDAEGGETTTPGTSPTPEEGAEHADKVWNG